MIFDISFDKTFSATKTFQEIALGMVSTLRASDVSRGFDGSHSGVGNGLDFGPCGNWHIDDMAGQVVTQSGEDGKSSGISRKQYQLKPSYSLNLLAFEAGPVFGYEHRFHQSYQGVPF